jgi:hypothetical protein
MYPQMKGQLVREEGENRQNGSCLPSHGRKEPVHHSYFIIIPSLNKHSQDNHQINSSLTLVIIFLMRCAIFETYTVTSRGQYTCRLIGNILFYP